MVALLEAKFPNTLDEEFSPFGVVPRIRYDILWEDHG